MIESESFCVSEWGCVSSTHTHIHTLPQDSRRCLLSGGELDVVPRRGRRRGVWERVQRSLSFAHTDLSRGLHGPEQWGRTPGQNRCLSSRWNSLIGRPTNPLALKGVEGFCRNMLLICFFLLFRSLALYFSRAGFHICCSLLWCVCQIMEAEANTYLISRKCLLPSPSPILPLPLLLLLLLLLLLFSCFSFLPDPSFFYFFFLLRS